MAHDRHADPAFRATVVHLVSEYWPYARSGGLAEAVRGIARYQAQSGVPTMVILPLHRQIRRDFPWIEPRFDLVVRVGSREEQARLFHLPTDAGTPEIYFVANDDYFDRPDLYGDDGGAYADNHRRFAFFCRAALEALPRLSPGPTLIHAHDWHTALALLYLRTTLAGDEYFDAVSTVMTVHNAGFQGYYGPEVLDEVGIDRRYYHWRFLEWYGQVNLLKGALVCADMVTTVSPTHADELRTRVGGFGLQDVFRALGDRFVGILNGIELDLWNPADDPELPRSYGAGLYGGKGAVQEAAPAGVRLPHRARHAGGGDERAPGPPEGARPDPHGGHPPASRPVGLPGPRRAILPRAAERRWPGGRRTGSPCVSTSRRSSSIASSAARTSSSCPRSTSRAGSPRCAPSATGRYPWHDGSEVWPTRSRIGVTGFLFDEYEPRALRGALEAALALYGDPEAWHARVREAMRRDFGWARSVDQYRDVYRKAAQHRASRPPIPAP